jgi:hypothetical protein
MALITFFNSSDLKKCLQQQIEKPGAKKKIGGFIGFSTSTAFLSGFAYQPLVQGIAALIANGTANPQAAINNHTAAQFMAFFVLVDLIITGTLVGAAIGAMFDHEKATPEVNLKGGITPNFVSKADCSCD